MTKQRNRGLRKRCECPRKDWAKCSHPWHFNFKWKDEHYRFSLDREVVRTGYNGNRVDRTHR